MSRLLYCGLLVLLALPCTVRAQTPYTANTSGDDYAGLLGYLADSRVDGQALAGSRGAIAANLAAGDGNLQANLRAMSVGEHARVELRGVQQQRSNQYDEVREASASIGGQALQGASGLVSINQASGNGNAEMNIVSAALATQGIRETSDEALASPTYLASAGGRPSEGPGSANAGTRKVAVESSALQGFEGVLQLNQIAGSANATGNQLSLSVQAVP